MTATPAFGKEFDDYKDQLAKEWGTYRAVSPINHNGVLAYSTGDPVPVSNVKLYGYLKDGLVEAVGSKDSQPVPQPGGASI